MEFNRTKPDRFDKSSSDPKTSSRSRRSKSKSVAATVSLASSDNDDEIHESASKSQKNNYRNDKHSLVTSKGFKRHFASHNYHDYGQLRPSQADLENTAKALRGGVHTPFPLILHRLMDDAQIKGFTDSISWQPHGRAFLIKDPKAFVADVLPNYFKHAKLSSFQRQLSLYGFVRLTSEGPDRGAYYHECFLKSRPFLCNRIHRTRVKGTWVRTSSSPELEPNFYLMEALCDRPKMCSDPSDEVGSISICTESDGEPTNQSVVPASVKIGFELSFCPLSASQAPSSCVNTNGNSSSLKRVDQLQLDFVASTSSPMLPPPALPSSYVGERSCLPPVSLSSYKVDYGNSGGVGALKVLFRDTSDRHGVGDRTAKQSSFFEDDDELETFLTEMDLDLPSDVNEACYQLLA
jgi:HSF-type DNA-binding